MIREGFWRWQHEPDLPMPIANAMPWEGQAEFLRRLSAVEDAANFLQAKGWSTCRVCDRPNGSREFRTAGAEWPEGLRHYVETHNVRPSKAFTDYIERLSR